MQLFCRCATAPAHTEQVPPRGKRHRYGSIVDVLAELVFGDGDQRIGQADHSLGLPTVVTVHGPIDDDLYPYYRELSDDVGLVAISDRQQQLAPDLNWIGRVHNALRVQEWPFQAEKGDYALFLGRFAPYKGAHLAVQAAHQAGVPLVLAGKCNEPAEKAYFEQCVRPLLTENDHVFGVADAASKRKLLADAQCLLFPIQWEEPFGIVMIEAMTCGTPVVALRGGAVGEVVVDGVTGLICEEPTELPAAIERARELDPASCRRHVAANFGVAQLGSGYERIYQQVLSSRIAPKIRPAVARVVDSEESPCTGLREESQNASA